jgi:tetratricopeptide (TPR) repeat protein
MINKTKSKKGRSGLTRPRSAAKKPAQRRPTAAKPQQAKGKMALNASKQKPRSAPAAPPPPPPLIRRKLTPDEVAHQHALERFENGLELFNQNQFSKARGIFERLKENPARELAERARVYFRICEQRLSRSTLQLKTAEDYYNYAVGLANQGNAEESEEYLLKALKLSPKSDYIYYALATTYAQRDNLDGALEHLGKAIALNERNRYQAQNDADFANLLEDPRFTELLYPEKPIA